MKFKDDFFINTSTDNQSPINCSRWVDTKNVCNNINPTQSWKCCKCRHENYSDKWECTDCHHLRCNNCKDLQG